MEFEWISSRFDDIDDMPPQFSEKSDIIRDSQDLVVKGKRDPLRDRSGAVSFLPPWVSSMDAADVKSTLPTTDHPLIHHHSVIICRP